MNPSTGEQIREVPMANAADVDAAVQSARCAFPAWRATPPLRRARILARFRELLEANQKAIATLISEEHGKVLLDAMGSVQRGIEVVEFAAGAPHLLKGSFSESVGRDVDAYSIQQPVGVCAGITPFNFPAMVPLWMYAGRTRVRKHVHPEAVGKGPVAVVLMAELAKRRACRTVF
jgi:malonate-semialdehyde dehydrogenase (acetylating)/methylmalonate-semialdehyde dehydrogenase